MNTAATHIAHKRAQTLYARKGSRYVQVSDPWAYDSLREGTYLVQVRPGSTTIRQAVWPDRAEVDAALRDLEDELVDLIGKAARARPTKQQLTPEERRLWDELLRVGGDGWNLLSYDSIADIADTITRRVREQVEKRRVSTRDHGHGDDDDGCR